MATTVSKAPKEDDIPLAVRRYEVLYYKRKNKVHKSKGVAKCDGILSVAPPPSCIVTLVDADADQHEDDEEEDDEEVHPNKKKRQKPKWKTARKKTSKLSSGINWDVSKRAFGTAPSTTEESSSSGLQVDDIVLLPQFECQIVKVLFSDGSISKPNTANATMFQKKRSNVAPLQLHTMTNNLVRMKKHPKSSTTALASSNAAPTSSSAPPTDWKARRIPPRQPQQPLAKQKHIHVDSSNSDEENHLPKRLCTGSKPIQRGTNGVSRLLSKPKLPKPLVVVSNKTKQIPAVASAKHNPVNPSFPGAIGNVVVPPSVRAVLRPHQREGVSFLWNCLTGASPSLRQAAIKNGAAATTRGAILADEMGLGKTLMTISTIFALHRRQKDHRFVVVCPSSLVGNWAKEFDKWLGKASQPKRVAIRKGGEEGLRSIRAFVPVKPHQSEVLIISYDLFRMNASVLTQAKQIGLLVVDEGHRLKNTAGSLTLSALETLNCESRLLITGTPIQNNLSEFHNVANFVCRGLLGDLPTFRREYERPISAANNKNATREQRLRGQSSSQALELITKTFMLRRLQKDILKSLLPPRSELLLFCRPSRQQCDIYKRITSKAIDATTSGASADALMILTNVRKLCSHPTLLNTSFDPSTLNENDVSLSGKLAVLEGLLSSIRNCNPSDKVVIVSNFTSALSVIEATLLNTKGWPFKRLDGSTEQCNRQSLVDSFNRATAEQSFVFLLSSKAGGCGLNLIGANRLVMFDPDWNPATDMQAMARIYRQGQAKPCFVYRFFTSGTVEEVVYQRQHQKGNLASLTVDGSSTTNKAKSTGFTKEELRDCFTLKEGCACDTKRKVGNQWSHYDGVEDLISEGCCDEPLLAVAEDLSDTLAFVRLVDDEPVEDETPKDTSKACFESKVLASSDQDSSDDDDECEFEG